MPTQDDILAALGQRGVDAMLPFTQRVGKQLTPEEQSQALDLILKYAAPIGAAGAAIGFPAALAGPEALTAGGLATNALMALLAHKTPDTGVLEAIGFATPKGRLEALRQAFVKMTEGKPWLKNPVAEESNRYLNLKGPQKHPEDVYYHGGKSGLGYLESPGIKDQAIVQDPNVSLGTHLGSAYEVSEPFLRRSGGGRSLYLAKVKAGNPRYYIDEDQLQRELLAEGLLTGHTQETIERNLALARRNSWDIPEERQIGAMYADKNWPALTKLIINRAGYDLPPQAQDIVGTNLLRRMAQRGEDAIIYGNLGEGWKGAPSVIVPFREQINKLKEIKVDAYGNPNANDIRNNMYIYTRHTKPTLKELLEVQGQMSRVSKDYKDRLNEIFSEIR